MPDTIYWYDLETSGLDPIADRPLQFAGLRTDLELRPVGQAETLYGRLSEDVLPAPEAMLVSGISLELLQREGLSEVEFITRINREFTVPGSCVTGFNSIRFDDEFIRNALYRNLLDPYAREWQGGNSRWDVIDLFRTAYALRPDGMEWPVDESGTPSFRLEELARENGVEHRAAHDALSDVEATIALVRKQRQCQPRLYDFLFDLRQKRKVLDQLYPLGKRMVLHISRMYPSVSGCLAIVLPLCTHPTNSNGVILYDLSVDPTPLLEMPAQEIHRLMFAGADELAPGEVRIPLKTLHINRSPAVAPLATLSESICSRLKLERERCVHHMELIQRSAGVVEKIQEALLLTRFPPRTDPDEMLYEGDFFSPGDRQTMERIRTSPPAALGGMEIAGDDTRLPEMVFRFRARNFPETLSSEEQVRWQEVIRGRWGDGAGIQDYLARLERCMADRGESARDRAVLEELANYANGRIALLGAS